MKKELFKILYKYKNFFLAVNLFLLIYEIARFYPPKIIGNIIDKMVEGANYETYMKYFAMLALSVLVYCTARTIYKWTLRVVSGKHEKDIKDIVFAKLLKIDLTSIQNIKNGELMSYVTKYIKDIKAGIYGIIAYGIRQIISLILLIYFMFAINIRLTIIILIPMVITTIVVIILKNKIRIAHTIAQESYTKMSEFVQESTDSIRTTKAFNGESKQIKDFYEKSNEVEEKNINLSIYRALLWTSMAVCFGVCYAISIIYGSKLINSDIISIGDFVAFNAFIKELYYPILSIPQLLVRYERMQVAISKLDEFFKLPEENFKETDSITEKYIINNIRSLLKGKTCIIISNRISDVKNADKIIVLDKGKIIQSGIHNDLLKVDGLYRDFYNQQSSSIETI